MAHMFGVHPTVAGGWKKQALAGLPDSQTGIGSPRATLQEMEKFNAARLPRKMWIKNMVR